MPAPSLRIYVQASSGQATVSKPSSLPLPYDTCQTYTSHYFVLVQMHDGLEKDNGSSILMLPTYVLKLPTG